jgi:hypothetical protein
MPLFCVAPNDCTMHTCCRKHLTRSTESLGPDHVCLNMHTCNTTCGHLCSSPSPSDAHTPLSIAHLAPRQRTHTCTKFPTGAAGSVVTIAGDLSVQSRNPNGSPATVPNVFNTMTACGPVPSCPVLSCPALSVLTCTVPNVFNTMISTAFTLADSAQRLQRDGSVWPSHAIPSYSISSHPIPSRLRIRPHPRQHAAIPSHPTIPPPADSEQYCVRLLL